MRQIFGAGGHGAVIADILRSQQIPIRAFVDTRTAGTVVAGITVLAPREADPTIPILVAIGDNAARERVARDWTCISPPAVHTSAVVAPNAMIGAGTVIMAGAIVNPGVRIGAHCIVNTGATVDHDCILEDFASLGPGVHLGGTTKIGRGAAISIGATILHGRTIGAYTVVGAGAVVTRDLPDRVVAYGVPARVIRSRTPEDRYL